MKTFNLVVAIVYTIFYVAMGIEGAMTGDTEMVVGIVMLSLPVITNWLTFKYWK